MDLGGTRLLIQFGTLDKDNYMAKKIILTLSEEEYELLTSELSSLYMYHWNSDNIHANDCGSKSLEFLEGRKTEIDT
jgi:uncharacterized protein YqgQ